MSWPLASFAIVFAVLAGGWLAYERSRPSARMAAVVGTLAALAAIGRDAFVALPDVKPITAVTLVVGYALGPLPGFTVGAVGMLASNVVLGQGPYTPWQMAAWGIVGLLGAALGALTGRRVNRLGLALACALTALLAKEIMNVYEWTVGASHSPAALLAVAARGLPFDVTDTVASFLFGMLFGPELARLLMRLRARMSVRWEPAESTVVVVLAALMLGVGLAPRAARAGGTASSPARVSPLAGEVAYLARAQNRDGGFGPAAGQRSSELYSAWAAIGLAAAGRSPLGVTREGRSVLDAIRAQAATLEGVGDAERTILALHACGAAIAGFPGDPLDTLMRARARDGSFGGLVDTTTFAIFALRAAGRSANDPAVHSAAGFIERQQGGDGGLGFATRGSSEDVDDTASALQGLIDAFGERASAVARAVAYLRRAQNADGGYPQQPGGPSNAQSTAWALQGLIAAGVDVSSVRRAGSRSPREYLQSLVEPDGSVRYSRTSDQTPVWVTAQALIALAGKPFPVQPAPTRRMGRTALAGARGGLHVSHMSPSRAAVAPGRPTRSSTSAGVRGARGGGGTVGSLFGGSASTREQTLARGAGVLLAIVLSPALR